VRLFTGIELDDAARQAAAAVIEELRRRAAGGAPRARVTWVASERLHLTLRFIGEVGDTAAHDVISSLRDPLPVSPFAMTFDRLGAFPPKGPPRVLWIGVAGGRESVVRAEAAVSERLARLGMPREDRPYSPHMTLARVREPAGLRAATLFDGLVPRLGATRVDAITLFQSKLSPNGPAYVVLERTALRGA
jgi:2'-5' RNA ligase